MLDSPAPRPDDDRKLFGYIAGRFDAPAYVRRARRVEQQFDDLITKCRAAREELLTGVRLHYRFVAHDVSLPAWTDDGDAASLLAGVRAALSPTQLTRRVRWAVQRLNESVTRFNLRWREFVDQLDLSAVNSERENYNRYYVLEKECALRSERLARLGFAPLPPVTTADVLAVLPLVPTEVD